MTPPRRWFDRKFQLGLEPDAATELLARLRRTPERLADAVRGLPPEVLTRKHDGKWSIQENGGHLLDLEPL
jgi:DinB superfamily